jgi:voltage-gated potassium channel
MNRRGVQYVAASTMVVLFAGAAGMYAFERHVPGSPLQTFVDALWWTAMLLTTIASDYWPRTAEGRALTLFLSAYALAILGYVAAALASFFIGQETGDEAVTSAEIATLRHEIAMLREELATRPGDRGGIG